jgi:group I intron endonuclease
MALLYHIDTITHIPKISGVYGIKNTQNDKWYIGSSVDIRGRILTHIRRLRSYRHNPELQNSWNKYNESDWEFHVLEKCEPVRGATKGKSKKFTEEYIENMKKAWILRKARGK